MSTQSYYKDRLGFDPREALYESSGGSTQSTTIKTGSRRVVQQQHYSSSTTQAHHSNGSGGYYSTSPAKKLKQSVYSSSNTAISSASYVSGSPGAQIGANIAAINSNSNNQGDGYEDALTQFKGTMSIWDYFVENRDVTGMILNTTQTMPPRTFRVCVDCNTVFYCVLIAWPGCERVCVCVFKSHCSWFFFI